MTARTSPEATLSARGALPKLQFAASLDEIDGDIDTFIVPVFRGDSGLELAGGPTRVLSSEQEIELWKLLTSVGAQGNAGEITTLPGAVLSTEPSADSSQTAADAQSQTDSHSEKATASGGHPTHRNIAKILAVGLGDVEEISDEDIRQAAGSASRAAGTAATVVSSLGIFNVEAAMVGHALGAYAYTGQQTTTSAETIGTITVLGNTQDGGATAKRATSIARAVCFARDLVNAPANDLYPAKYAEIVASAAKASDLEVDILDEKELEAQGYGGIIGVGRGSENPPRLVRLTYTPHNADDNTPTVALVGKGITFDTGGVSLKPAANMWNMISDMGGSAAVVASILLASALKINAKVIATIPMAENMLSASAIRPGDILRHYDGQTTEVLNTDAEGRLILADAIARACEDKPDYLIETATLTGAQMVALGNRTPGIMGSHAFRDKVAMHSQAVGENGWPMPLPSELNEALKSDVADMRNISDSRWGGMSVAGHYLSRFVTEGVEWVHIDVAGPAYNDASAYGYTPKRGTGVPVRTILATLESIANGG
ncbi:leucyl aminopeptidase [Corynebacterium sp. 4HC-13]|uniref:leucyl aminopeptidase n=1 Tax=Corynebacterium anserum TaxID=2684406 RepID=UPI00163ADC2F|nr:leucyl aminopeptidase [Corynebacterium anserum]MBC2680952.1 leucyl aminopeptidase [Corynebacterium anserum]